MPGLHVETSFDQCDRRSRCLYLCSTCRCLPRSSPSSWTARMVDSSSTNTDGAATTRAILIGRAGGTTPSSSWQVYRTMLSLSPPRLRTTRSSRSARSSTGPTSRFGATTGRPFKQPPRLPSRHAHRPGLRGQQHVPLAARVLRRRVVVFLRRSQRSGSRELYADERPSSASHSGHRLVI
jgi:hypothetical protein